MLERLYLYPQTFQPIHHRENKIYTIISTFFPVRKKDNFFVANGVVSDIIQNVNVVTRVC